MIELLFPAAIAVLSAVVLWRDAVERDRKRNRVRQAWLAGFEAGRREGASGPAAEPEFEAFGALDEQPTDAVALWAMEAIGVDAAGRVNVADAHRAFSCWAAVNGAPPLDVRTFGRAFNAWAEARGARRLKSHGAVLYQGLALDVSGDATPLGAD